MRKIRFGARLFHQPNKISENNDKIWQVLCKGLQASRAEGGSIAQHCPVSPSECGVTPLSLRYEIVALFSLRRSHLLRPKCGEKAWSTPSILLSWVFHNALQALNYAHFLLMKFLIDGHDR